MFNKECTYSEVFFFSVFDGNFAPSGAAINLGYYDARLDNVSFSHHQGSAIRVQVICMQYYIYVHTINSIYFKPFLVNLDVHRLNCTPCSGE